MRVALITTAFAHCNNDYSVPPLINFVRSISAQIDVDVYAIDYPFQPRQYDLFGARVSAFGYGLSSRLFRMTAPSRVSLAVMQNHRENAYDLIHAVWANRPAEIAASLSKHLKLPLVTSFYAGEGVWLPEISYGGLKGARQRRRLAHVLAQSAVATAGSTALANLVQSAFEVPVRTVPFGYSALLFNDACHPRNLGAGRHVVTAASFGPVKGLDVLVDAVQILSDAAPKLLSDTTFRVFGPDPRDNNFRRALLQKITALPIVLHDAIPHWEMPSVYRAADLALVPSRFESQCFAAVEPAGCGTPVIGTSVGVLPDMVSAKWLSRPGDASALAHTLSHVLSAPGDWDHEAKRQRKWLSENLTLERARDNFLRLYKSVLNEKRAT